jgi:hypothetical protein
MPVIQITKFDNIVQRFIRFSSPVLPCRVYRIQCVVGHFGEADPERVLALCDVCIVEGTPYYRIGDVGRVRERVCISAEEFAYVRSCYVRSEDLPTVRTLLPLARLRPSNITKRKHRRIEV